MKQQTKGYMMQRSENNWHRARYAATLLVGCCIAIPAAIHAREIDDDMPPPGLYQIDLDGTTTVPLAGNGSVEMRGRSDGRTGDEVYQTYANGHAHEQAFKGNGPRTQCVGSSVVSLPPGLPGCVSQPGVRTKDGIVIKAKCASVESTTVIRKIATDTWEYATSVALFQPGIAGDLSGMRAMLEQQAKNAPTAKEREKAINALAELSERQRNMPQAQDQLMEASAKAERAAKTPEEAAMIRAARERMSGKTPMQEHVVKMRWTRISNICDATPKEK